jgi:hypothetical protein
MSTLQSLRNATLLARLVLVCWAFVTGVAIASPMVKPDTLAVVCSGAGVIQVLANGSDGGEAPAGHTLDCPLCLAVMAPPPVVRSGLLPAPAGTKVPPTAPDSQRPSRAGAPPPARAPPSLS